MARNKYPEETIRQIVDVSLQLFIQKGYEQTSIQDIIDHLSGLSKGAIYHHFKSKDEIFEAVCEKMGKENLAFYTDIRDDKSLNGLEKLKKMMLSACSNPNNDAMVSMLPKIISQPRFLKNQLMEIFEVVSPDFIRPVVEQGVADGSIKTEYPKEISEVLILLINIWMNPVVVDFSLDEMEQKLLFLQKLLTGFGLDLLDDEIKAAFIKNSRVYRDIN